MKKIISTLAASALFVLGAQADFLRAEVGLGSWQSSPSGTLTDQDGNTADLDDNLGYDTEGTTYVWVNFKHFVPVLPNLRLEQTNMEFTGKASGSFDWEGFTLSVPDDAKSTLTMNQTDIVLYYNLLDETAWMTLDLGIDAKMLDLDLDLKSSTEDYSESLNVTLPMLYLRGRVNVPTTDLAVEADVKYIGYGDSKVYDARIKADYTFDAVPVVKPAIEVGYRVQKVEIDDDSIDINCDVEFSGMYAGVVAKF
jgi:outer membrane protein